MPVIQLAAFGGERPVLNPRLLPQTAATHASNVRLSSGTLAPIHKPAPAGQILNAGAKTIYRHGAEWLSWPGVVQAVPGPVAEERLYITGDGVPKLRVDGITYPLAVPRPVLALETEITGAGSGDTQSRTYVYTFVTGFGEESAPCPAAPLIDWKPGQTVTLSGFEAPPIGRNILRQRIYRTQTGSAGTFLYLISERPASTNDFIDNLPADAFQEALPSLDWTAPPAGLSGLVGMANGMMAAFVGRDVYFCEPWRPHAWPEKYVQTCDSEVDGLASIGSALIVMTTAHPYVMLGSHPDSVQSTKLEANFPCINARGIVDLGNAICYPSREGLVAVAGDGSVKLATAQLFDRDAWLRLSPATMMGGQLNGEYLLFYDTFDAAGDRYYGSLFINIMAEPFLVRSDEIASSVYYSVADQALYFTRPNDTRVYEFNAPGAPPQSYYWRSKEFVFTAPQNLGVILIDAGDTFGLASWAAIEAETLAIQEANAEIFASGEFHSEFAGTPLNTLPLAGDPMQLLPNYLDISVTVYGDGKIVRTITRDGSIERLPGGFKARTWEVDVRSNIEIEQIIVASTVDQIRSIV